MDPRLLPTPIVIEPRSSIPLLLSIPHSGRDYPGWLLDQSTGGEAALQTLEDPLVDRLAWRALQTGIGAVIARAPRAAIDCNRAEGEIDCSVVAGAVGSDSDRAKAGLGIIPGRTARHGHLWRRPLDRAELERRIAAAHAPYHRSIERGLDRIAIKAGIALLLDCHSMPPRNGQAEVVIGNCHGAAASAEITDAAARIARAGGWTVALNQPYAGGHVIARHACPAQNIHALQIEIDRTCYLAPDGRSPGPGFDRAARLLERLVLGLERFIEPLQFAIAAE